MNDKSPKKDTALTIPVGSLVVGAILIVLYGWFNGKMGPFLIICFQFALGFLGFTLLEYILHRFLFHYQAKTSKTKALIYKIHGIHHHHPLDMNKYKSPIYSRMVIVVVLFLLFEITMGTAVYGVLPGFLCGYAFYLYIHYIVHYCNYSNLIFKYLKRLHDIHHYRSAKVAYGVSSPLWDIVFRTYPKKKHFDKS